MQRNAAATATAARQEWRLMPEQARASERSCPQHDEMTGSPVVATLVNDVTGGAPKRLLVASPRGFCAGVSYAIEIVDLVLDHYGPPVWVRHEIVHNRHVCDRLRARGAIFVD